MSVYGLAVDHQARLSAGGLALIGVRFDCNGSLAGFDKAETP